MRGVKSKRSSLFLPQSGINENWRRNYSLTADQRAALQFIEDVLAPMGVDVVLYSSETNRTLPNGMYDGNRIYIDIEASMTERSRQTFVMYAIAHELTHMAERLSPELWSKYADAVVEILAKEDGKTPTELIRERQLDHEQAELERLRKVYYGKDEAYIKSKVNQLDEAGAIKEIVADASQLILTRSSNFAEKLKAKDEGLFKKIIALVKKAIKKMQEILGGLDTPDDGVSAAVEKHLDELTEYFDDMLADTLYKAGYTNETELTDIGEMQFQIRYEPTIGKSYVEIDAKEIIGTGISPSDSIGRKARLFLRNKFRNVILPVGKTKSTYIRSEGINEYTNPAKYLDSSSYDGKMLAATELDNLLSASEYLSWENDDGRHPDVIRWLNYKTIFLYEDENGDKQVLEGIVKIKRIKRGDCFYDITKIENITQGNMGQAIIKNAAQSQNGVLNNSISQIATFVNISRVLMFRRLTRKL